jgi:hypothetical protein
MWIKPECWMLVSCLASACAPLFTAHPLGGSHRLSSRVYSYVQIHCLSTLATKQPVGLSVVPMETVLVLHRKPAFLCLLALHMIDRLLYVRHAPVMLASLWLCFTVAWRSPWHC